MADTRTSTLQEQQQFEHFINLTAKFKLQPLDFEHVKQYIEQRQAFAKMANETMNENDRNAALNMVMQANQLIKNHLLIP